MLRDAGRAGTARGLALVLVAGCGSKTGLLAPPSTLDAGGALDAQREAGGDAADGQVVVGFDAADDTAAGIAVALDGLRWELPCRSDLTATTCTTPSTQRVSATLRGPAGERYLATLRFRGVVETKGYVGGSNDGAFWQVGGAPSDGGANVYGLAISSPPQQYFLNRETANAPYCFALDYEETVPLDTGATVVLDAASIDGRELQNHDPAGAPIVVAGVPPAPRPFDGQFIQLDVVGLERIR